MIIKTKDGWKPLGEPINFSKFVKVNDLNDWTPDQDDWREGLKALNGDDRSDAPFQIGDDAEGI